MSMGQKKRVAIAKSLVEPAALYLWDEPTNYLDVFNQDQLLKLLRQVQPAMILVEHDQEFIRQIAGQRIQLKSEISEKIKLFSTRLVILLRVSIIDHVST